MQDLLNRRSKIMDELKKEQELYRQQIEESVLEDSEYRKEYSKEIIIEDLKGTRATLIENIVRGKENVLKHRTESRLKEGLAKATQEKINILKIEIKNLQDDIEAMRKGV